MIKLARTCLAAVLVAAASASAFAEALKITEVRAPILMLWGDTEGSSLIAEIPKSDVATPLLVESVSKNLMLKTTVNGETGWIFGHHVKTNSKVKLSAECDPNVSAEQLGAVRGLGEGCD